MERENKNPILKNSKWVSTAASVWIQCAVGASYTFGLYSAALKSTQGYDQSTLDTVSVFKDMGANAGVISGLLYAAVAGESRRRKYCGPWVVLIAGAAQCFVGYAFMWAAVAGIIRRPAPAMMCVFMFLAAHGQTFFNTANVVSGVQNFPGYSGTIVGIMKGFLGLSGAILVRIYDSLCQGSPTTYLLVLALLPALVTLFLAPFVRIHTRNSSLDDKKHLNAFSIAALGTAFCVMAIIIVENAFSLSSVLLSFRVGALVTIMIVVVVFPIWIVIRAHRSRSEEEERPGSSAPLLVSEGKGEGEEEMGVRDMNIVEVMRGLDFWLLSLAMVAGMGSGLATINNMSQVGESLGYTTAEINTFVSLWSIWNFLGRFGAGYLSDHLLRARGWPRPAMIVATLASLSLGHLVIASGLPGNLYAGSILVGICYGSQWSLMPTITSEIFGVRHMGTIFNAIAIASPVGSYLFSVRVIGYVYDREASGEDSCTGSRCFMVSFFVMAAVALFGCLVAVVLFFRTRRFYRVVVFKRLNLSSSSR